MRWIPVTFLLILPTVATAQSPTAEAALEIRRLESKIDATERPDRLELLERRVKLDDTDGRWWRQLALARFSGGQLEGAIQALRRAVDLGDVWRPDGECTIAEWLVPADPDKAVEALKRCVDAGHRDLGRLAGNSKLKPLINRDDVALLLGLATPDRCEGVEGWRQDLAHLMAEIRRVHWLYRTRPLPEETLRRAAALESALPNLADPDIVVALQGVLASLEDGHSVLYPIGMRRGALAHLPLGFWLFDDGLYVVRSEPPHEDLVGREVVAIGGVPTKELVKRLGRFASHDNPSGFRWVVPVYLTFEEYLSAAGADLSLGLVFRGPDGQEETRSMAGSREPFDPSSLVLTLPPPPNVDPPLHLSRPGDAFWLTRLGEDAVYAQINRIGNEKNKTLDAFALELRRSVEVTPGTTLIVDLRHNPGGDARLLSELVRTLVTFDVGASEDKLLVLTSRNTFSATQTMLNDLERLTSALFIGEPPGTRPNRLGNEAPFRLPCSGTLGALSSGYNQGKNSRDERLWIPPDVPVQTTSSDYFGGRDPVLEVAQLIQQPRAAEQPR